MKKVAGLLMGVMLAMGLGGCHRHSKQATQLGSSSVDAYGKARVAAYQQSRARRDRDGRVINALRAPSDQTYYFSYDNSTVNREDYRAIASQAAYLAAHPGAKVRLEGNTDNRGSREYNIGLGWRRDQSIAHILAQYGARPNQINMISYGKERPAYTGNGESVRRLNRRVHFVYEAY